LGLGGRHRSRAQHETQFPAFDEVAAEAGEFYRASARAPHFIQVRLLLPRLQLGSAAGVQQPYVLI
jgi:hypothetical protein